MFGGVGLFSNSNSSLFGNTNNFPGNNLFKETKRKNKSKNIFFQCKHDKNYIAYNTREIAGPICYNCLFQNNLDLDDCLPLKETFDYYKSIYQNYINIFKERIEDIFNEFQKEIEKLNQEKSDNIDALLKNLNLNFELPIEISLEERIELALNKQLSEILNNIKNKIDEELPFNLLNIYESRLNDLKTKNSYLYMEEKIILSTKTPFTLMGLAIPKISNELMGSINISVQDNYNNYKKNEQIYLKESKIKNNLTIIEFENPIKMEKNIQYSITLSGLNGLTYIDDEEQYNFHNKLSIESNNKESILACLIIK